MQRRSVGVALCLERRQSICGCAPMGTRSVGDGGAQSAAPCVRNGCAPLSARSAWNGCAQSPVLRQRRRPSGMALLHRQRVLPATAALRGLVFPLELLYSVGDCGLHQGTAASVGGTLRLDRWSSFIGAFHGERRLSIGRAFLLEQRCSVRGAVRQEWHCYIGSAFCRQRQRSVGWCFHWNCSAPSGTAAIRLQRTQLGMAELRCRRNPSGTGVLRRRRVPWATTAVRWLVFRRERQRSVCCALLGGAPSQSAALHRQRVRQELWRSVGAAFRLELLCSVRGAHRRQRLLSVGGSVGQEDGTQLATLSVGDC
jgi:hypothetical protein